jgi:hypothetical protein
VAGSATVGQPGSESQIRVDVPEPVTLERTLSLQPGELALKDLASAPDGPERIAIDYEQRRAGSVDAPTTCANLLLERLGDALICDIRDLRSVSQLTKHWKGGKC